MILLAPAINLTHLTESNMKSASSNEWLQNIAVDMDYLEFGGAGTGNDLSSYIEVEYPYVCYADE